VTIKSPVLILKFEIQYLTVIIKYPLLFFTDTLTPIISTTQFDFPNHYNQLNSLIHCKFKTQVVVVLYNHRALMELHCYMSAVHQGITPSACCASDTDAVKLLLPHPAIWTPACHTHLLVVLQSDSIPTETFWLKYSHELKSPKSLSCSLNSGHIQIWTFSLVLVWEIHSWSLSKHSGYSLYILFYRVMMVVYDIWTHRIFGLHPSYVQHWNIIHVLGTGSAKTTFITWWLLTL
jgi:hypothetical protein